MGNWLKYWIMDWFSIGLIRLSKLIVNSEVMYRLDMFKYTGIILDIEYKDLSLEDETFLRGYKGSGYTDPVQLCNVRNTETGLMADIESPYDLSGLYPSLTIQVDEQEFNDGCGKIIKGKIKCVHFAVGVNVDPDVLPIPVVKSLRPVDQWGLND